MDWQELKETGEIFELLPEIWRHEQTRLPQTITDSLKGWRDTLDMFVAFVESCEAVWGFFDAEGLAGVVFMERPAPRASHMHLSVLRKPEGGFEAPFARLRDMRFRSGDKIIRTWLLKRNFGLRRIMEAVGFRRTGLILDNGSSRGRVLRWELFAAKAV